MLQFFLHTSLRQTSKPVGVRLLHTSLTQTSKPVGVRLLHTSLTLTSKPAWLFVCLIFYAFVVVMSVEDKAGHGDNNLIL